MTDQGFKNALGGAVMTLAIPIFVVFAGIICMGTDVVKQLRAIDADLKAIHQDLQQGEIDETDSTP